MGCNCGGSTPRAQRSVMDAPVHRRAERAPRNQAPPLIRRQGGPGTPGYVWNGPETDTPAPEPVAQPDEA